MQFTQQKDNFNSWKFLFWPSDVLVQVKGRNVLCHTGMRSMIIIHQKKWNKKRCGNWILWKYYQSLSALMLKFKTLKTHFTWTDIKSRSCSWYWLFFIAMVTKASLHKSLMFGKALRLKCVCLLKLVHLLCW